LYIYEHDDWPEFRWDMAKLGDRLADVRHRQGRLIGRMEALGFRLREEAALASLTEDVVKTSEIEGELLNRETVRSSIARRLGVDIGALAPADRFVDGVVEMMLDATQGYEKPLDEVRLFKWHRSLFPARRSGMSRIVVGAWRTDAGGPMQVVSGAMGHERIHFEAPAAKRLNSEMRVFLKWFNSNGDTDLVLKAGVAHLWFVTVHPFEDGNGRIARAVADLLLTRSERSRQRFYSMSSQIRAERKAYYSILEQTQKGDLDITPWLCWFLDCLGRAIGSADNLLSSVLAKARFWERHGNAAFNERQRVVLNRLFNGFEGKLTSSKWAKLCKCSQDTASRDIDDLMKRGVLVRDESGGRSTSYSLAPLETKTSRKS
jgi:Fic family protein